METWRRTDKHFDRQIQEIFGVEPGTFSSDDWHDSALHAALQGEPTHTDPLSAPESDDPFDDAVRPQPLHPTRTDPLADTSPSDPFDDLSRPPSDHTVNADPLPAPFAPSACALDWLNRRRIDRDLIDGTNRSGMVPKLPHNE